MNSLKTDIFGGFPWVLDDFRWHHDGVAEALKTIVKGINLNNGNAKIFGVDITGSGAMQDVSEGYLLVDGEIVKVDAHTVANINLGGDYRHVVVSDGFDPSGLKSLEDGGTANAYRKKRATIEIGTFPVGSDIVFSETTFLPIYNRIANLASGAFSSGYSVTLAASNPSPNLDGFLGGSFIKHKKVGRVCFMVLKLSLDLNADMSLCSFDTPAGITPTDTHDVCMTRLVGAGTYIGQISVTSAGKIEIISLLGLAVASSPLQVEASFSFPCNL